VRWEVSQMGKFHGLFAQAFDFQMLKHWLIIGGSGAMLSLMVAKHPAAHENCVTWISPAIAPIANEKHPKSSNYKIE